jgi:hypothetical protein
MALSEHEQKILAELEKQLLAEEPRLADTLAAPESVYRPISPAQWGLMIGGIVLGALALLAGVTWKLVPVGVAGFIIIALSVYLVVGRNDHTGAGRARRQSVSVGSSRGHRAGNTGRGSRHGQSRPGSPKGTSSFMKRLEERWDQRG